MSNLKRERHIMLRRDMLAAMREEQRLADLAGVQLTVTPIWWWVKRAVLRREAREARIRAEVWRLALEGGNYAGRLPTPAGVERVREWPVAPGGSHVDTGKGAGTVKEGT